MEEIKNNKIQELHPCQYCKKTCKGQQCKECHFKMIENKKNNCIDCKKLFFGLRNDGTKRKRCKDCQEIYNKKYISVCPICKDDYHAFLDDGRIFDKCYKCYKESLTNDCKNCKMKTLNGQLYCKKCYLEQKKNSNIYLLSVNDDENILKNNIPLINSFKQYKRTCKICNKFTFFDYCSECYKKYNDNNNDVIDNKSI